MFSNKKNIASNPPIRIFTYLFGPFKKGNNFQQITLTSRGRDSIQLACDYFNIGQEDVALIPAFTCDTVTGVFKGNCRMDYYDLKENLKINANEIERRLSENPKIKLLYVIHYFGFLHRNINELSLLCKSYGIILVEDHAHSALSQSNSNLSDIQIFSFRKLLPTADGGGLAINQNGFNHTFSKKSKITANIKGIIIALKRLGSLYSSEFRRYIGKVIQKDISNLNEGSSKITPLPISIFGKGIIYSADLQQNSIERRKQYKTWGILLEETPFEPLLPDLEEDTVPIGYPVKVCNNKEIVEYFKKYNIHLKIHWAELPKEALASCPVSLKISRSSITLPIYPGLKITDMKFIRDELLKCAVPV